MTECKKRKIDTEPKAAKQKEDVTHVTSHVIHPTMNTNQNNVVAKSQLQVSIGGIHLFAINAQFFSLGD
jgi:hypothetical protein